MDQLFESFLTDEPKLNAVLMPPIAAVVLCKNELELGAPPLIVGPGGVTRVGNGANGAIGSMYG